MDVWDLYFATVAGWKFHPGAGTKDSKCLSLEECADIADQMILIRDKRILPNRGD